MKDYSTRKIVIAAAIGIFLLGMMVFLLVITPKKQNTKSPETQNDAAQAAVNGENAALTTPENGDGNTSENVTVSAPESSEVTTTPDSGDTNQSSDATGETVSVENGVLKAEVRMESSWDSGTGKSYQYTIKLTNTGSETVSGWNILLDFGTMVTMETSWNGTIEASKTGFNIGPVDYNYEITAGSYVEVGMIITAAEPVKIQITLN